MNTKVWTLAKAERAANYMNAMHGAATLTAIEMVCTLYNTTHTHTHTHKHTHAFTQVRYSGRLGSCGIQSRRTAECGTAAFRVSQRWSI